MTVRRRILDLLAEGPCSASSLARELGLRRGDVESDLRHAIRSAEAAGEAVVIVPARCRACGFEFGPDRLLKPGKCPECRASRIVEAQIALGR